MGLEYYIVDILNQRMIWLGKGAWGDLLPEERGKAPIESLDLNTVNDRVWEVVRGFQDVERDWALGVAKKVWAFCNTALWYVELRHDSTEYDDEYTEGATMSNVYKCVWSRYEGEKLDDDPLELFQQNWEKWADHLVRLQHRLSKE